MKNAPMRFDGMSLRHNPETLVVSGKNHIREVISPCCESDSRNLGREPVRITGEGVFCGADCAEQYRALEGLQRSGKSAKLVFPGAEPLYAYLKELSLTAKPMDDVLSYRFVFIETQIPRREGYGGEIWRSVIGSENLWDLSFAYEVPIERLVALNPHIPRIDDLRIGERVRIC